MSSVVFAVPYTPPPPKVRPFNSYRHTWTGPDGSVWGLSDPSTGVFLVRDGIVGLHLPPVERHVSESPGSYGSRFRGSRVQARPIEWLVHVYSDTDSVEWMERDRAFWGSFSFNEPGTWEVQAPNGKARRIRCRLDSDGGYSFGHDPAGKGWATYPVNLIADEPFWRGDPVSREWPGNPDEGLLFNELDGGAPPFFISNSTSAGGAVMMNPGDVEAWPVWTVTGPAAGVTVTVDGGTVGLPDLSAGQTLVVNTDPRVATAIVNGTTDKSAQATPWDPRPIPPGESVPVTIEADELNLIRCDITPLFYRGL